MGIESVFVYLLMSSNIDGIWDLISKLLLDVFMGYRFFYTNNEIVGLFDILFRISNRIQSVRAKIEEDLKFKNDKRLISQNILIQAKSMN